MPCGAAAPWSENLVRSLRSRMGNCEGTSWSRRTQDCVSHPRLFPAHSPLLSGWLSRCPPVPCKLVTFHLQSFHVLTRSRSRSTRLLLRNHVKKSPQRTIYHQTARAARRNSHGNQLFEAVETMQGRTRPRGDRSFL
jgi:hypothetical protein